MDNLTAFFSEQYLIVALVIGIASGLVGSFVILRRMALVGDALSHVALPGIALALFWQVDPFWGAFFFLILAAVLVWWLEGRTKLPGDAIVGLLFTASLALGILGLPGEEILDSLFGSFAHLSPAGFVGVVTASLAIAVAMLVASRRILLEIFTPEIAAIKDPKRLATLFFLLLFSSVVALGIKLVGTLLMGALTIIPAAIAKNASRSMTGYVVSSAILGGSIAMVGAFLAGELALAPGPVIIIIGVAFFLVTVIFRRG